MRGEKGAQVSISAQQKSSCSETGHREIFSPWDKFITPPLIQRRKLSIGRSVIYEMTQQVRV